MGGNAAAQGIINLGTLGAAGQALLHWFGVA